MSGEPTTEAGRALLISVGRDEPDDWDDLDWVQVISGIEAEARAEAVTRIDAWLTRTHSAIDFGGTTYYPDAKACMVAALAETADTAP